MLQRLLPWFFGLLWFHLCATYVLYRTARLERRRATDLDASGLFSVPTPEAIADAATLPAALVAALAFTLTLGLLVCVIARSAADLLAARPRIWRLLPLAAGLVVVLGGMVIPDAAPWIGLALVLVVPYGLFLLLPGRPPSPQRAGIAWLGALLVLVPVLCVATSDHLRDARTAMLAVPSGEAMVNAYYRSALLAAEPIKGPRQQLALTYQALDTTALPAWFRCQPGPPPLLPVADPGHADLVLQGADDGAIRIASRGEVTDESTWDQHFAAWAAAQDPRLLRALVALGMVVGLPLALAVVITSVVHWRPGRQRLRGVVSLALCFATGAALAGLLVATAQQVDPEPVIDGHGAERIAAASARSTPLRELERMARQDTLLPVRAHALAEQVRRARQPEALEDAVRAAQTWYEQWHGYNALLGRGWDPRRHACPGLE